MAQIVIRNIEPKVVSRLKLQAKRHGRSLEGETRQILTQSAGFDAVDAKKTAAQWRRKLSGKKFPNTTKLLKQDRSR